jgi:hypothetical protein
MVFPTSTFTKLEGDLKKLQKEIDKKNLMLYPTSFI